jgi:tRNA G18 (ribose-2'-O)-methylase SpoU
MTKPRNVIDHYHYWKTDAIKADLNKKRYNYSVFLCNLYNDFNIATVVRNANAFLAREIILFGSKRYDKRGTVGTHHYSNFYHFPEENWNDVIDFFSNTDSLEFVGIDNIPQAENINTFQWNPKKHTVMVFGQEQVGIEDKILELCNRFVYIPQYGSVRSLNVGCASAIMMNDYCSKMV